MGIIEVFQPEDINNLPAVSEVATDYKAGNVHRQTAQKAALLMATLEKVVEPAGDQFKKVTWEEYERMYSDPHFVSRATYEFDLVCFTNGQRRPKPLRPIAQNEVGMYGGKIVYLADRAPGDIGERLFSVPVSINKETHMIIDDKLVAVSEELGTTGPQHKFVGIDLAAAGTRDVAVEQDMRLIGGQAVPVGEPRYSQSCSGNGSGDGCENVLPCALHSGVLGRLPPEFFDATSRGDLAGAIAVAEVSIGGKTPEEAVASAEAYKATVKWADEEMRLSLVGGRRTDEDVSPGEAHMRALGEQIARSTKPTCEYCGKPATCFGAYEGADSAYACDSCCQHGNEDGRCSPVNSAERR